VTCEQLIIAHQFIYIGEYSKLTHFQLTSVSAMHFTKAALMLAVGLTGPSKALASHMPVEPRAPTILPLNARLTEQRAKPMKASRPALSAKLPLMRELPMQRDVQLKFELIKQFQVKHVFEA
jgi:hypothetical protein